MKRLVTSVKRIGSERMCSAELWLEYMPAILPADRVSVEVTHTKGGRKAVFTYKYEE